ncbi:MAG TPA: S41 family peptidase [Terriglobales bacterium]|jgi:carboxyl-terminal processing protease|nr:S41 family peptidase [Terriglobales bacterium]
MSTKLKVTVIASSLAILLFTIVGEFVHVRASSNDGAYRQLSVYSEVLSRIRLEYVEEPNIAGVTDGALHGLLESLDANSSYLSPEEYKHYKTMKSGGKADIGAAVSKRFGYAAVVAIIPGGPSEKAGIENSDIIESIEGKSTHDMSLAEIHSMLSGEVGSTLNVAVVRPRHAEPQKIVITRDVVVIPPVSEKMLGDNVGYIQVDAFPEGKSQEIADKIRDLQRQGAKKLVLDLRNSASGLESEGVATANLFLDHGTITYLQGQKYPREAFNADPAKDITKLPVAVLVNRGTAGPAEIVASAILENARGDVVGDKTFGDGSKTRLFEMPDNSALILSVAKYYTPGGKAIQDTAVTPNVLVADSTADDDGGLPDEDQPATPDEKKEAKPKSQTDDQLNKALEVLKNRDAKG